MDDITKKDLYDFLGVSETCTESDIKKAFRQKALTCHPDKNPDDPQAANLFREVSKACQILLDPEARKAYDKIFKTRKDRAARNRQLDAGRKKLKDDLEAREEAAKQGRDKEVDQALKLSREIERLRREGSKLLEKENEDLRKQIEKERKESVTGTSNQGKETRVKVSWKGSKIDTSKVKTLFERFGPVHDFVVSSKGNSALVVYPDAASAVKAVSSPLINGFTSVKILDTLPPNLVTPSSSSFLNNTTRSTDTPADYEESVLEKLRKKAQEQKEQKACLYNE